MNRIARTGRTTLQVAVCFALLLAFAVVANAQTFVTAATTTTLWAGSQDTTTFGFTAYTAPFPGVILTGTAISAVTGKPVRHLWYGDPLNGFCRIDPELDQVIPPVAGIGGHNPNIQSCLASIQAKGITPGQVAFDGANNIIYSEDTSRTNAGVFRAHYIPSGDNGQGSIDIIHVDSLVGTQAGRNQFGGCPQLKDPKTGTLVPVVPNSAALGPDGNLYVGSIRDGAIIRIISPATFNNSTDCDNPGSSGQSPTEKIQIPILSSDEKFGSGHTFGLGWIGHTLFGADNIAPWIMQLADQCLTPVNGNRICGSPAVSGAAMPTEILAAQVAGPQAGLVSDAIFGQFSGAVLYAATFPNITRITNVASATNMTVNLNYGGTFSFVTGMAADPQDLNNATVYVGADPTQGGINGSGQIWQVVPNTPAPAPPATPTLTSAVAGPGTGQATVTWAPTLNGQPITSYVVKTLLSTLAASGVANVTVLAPTTTATISGLTVGTSYVFEVQACNATGCSAFSAPSAVVTAFAVTAPPAPTSVTAVDAGNGTSAVVAWVQSGNGNSPITSSTISAFNAVGTLVSTSTVLGTATGGTISGLTCGSSYTFSVVATNAVGPSAASASSTPATAIACQTNADLAVSMSAPATINAGSVLTYTITVSNGGPGTANSVSLTDALPAPLSSLPTSTAGACGGTVGLTSLTCNLGNMAPGSSATVTVSVLLAAGQTSPVVNTAKVTSLTADPILTNNSATASTTITTGTIGNCTPATTDIQVGGSAQNGGPALGSSDTYNWQIKNNLGTVTANCVVFTQTLPPTFSFFSATPSTGTCTTPAVGSLGGTITCNIPSIAGGGQALITVNVGVGSVAGTFSSTGSATFTGTDTQTANNQFTVNVQPK